MVFVRSSIVFLLGVTGLLWVPPLSGAQDSRSPVQASVASALGSPGGLPKLPAGRASVAYQNDRLTINSQSAPLIDILHEVCSQIGAELDAPSEANEPVVGVFGPGPARDVLLSLLDGSRYELGTAGSAEDAQAIVRVVVFPKSKSSEAHDAIPSILNATTETTAQAQTGSTSTAEKADAQEMIDILREAKTTFAGNESDTEPGARLVKGQTDDIFKALEALIKSGVAAEASGSADSVTTAPKTNGAAAVSRTPMQRRRRTVGNSVPDPL